LIIKLEFDVFYTIIRISINTDEFNVDEICDEFYNWMLKDPHYNVKTQYGYSFLFDDDVFINWLSEVRFNMYNVEILEKHLGICEDSKNIPDIVMYF